MQVEPWPRLENISPHLTFSCVDRNWLTSWIDWRSLRTGRFHPFERPRKFLHSLVGFWSRWKNTKGLVKVWMILEIDHLKFSQVNDQAIRCTSSLTPQAVFSCPPGVRSVGPRFAQRLRSRRLMGPDMITGAEANVGFEGCLMSLKFWPFVSFS